jgi:hypothetical protein
VSIRQKKKTTLVHGMEKSDRSFPFAVYEPFANELLTSIALRACFINLIALMYPGA